MKQTKIYCTKNFEKFKKMVCPKKKTSNCQISSSDTQHPPEEKEDDPPPIGDERLSDNEIELRRNGVYYDNLLNKGNLPNPEDMLVFLKLEDNNEIV